MADKWGGALWRAERIRAKAEGRPVDHAAVERRIENARQLRMPMRKDVPRKPVDRQLAYLKHVERKYGLGRAEYLRLFQSQDCRCAVCHRDLELFSAESSPVVDHCHATGKVRGILCNGCNVRVGRLEADPEHDLNRMANAYIEKHR
jgi:hypothetical protein